MPAMQKQIMSSNQFIMSGGSIVYFYSNIISLICKENKVIWCSHIFKKIFIGTIKRKQRKRKKKLFKGERKAL